MKQEVIGGFLGMAAAVKMKGNEWCQKKFVVELTGFADGLDVRKRQELITFLRLQGGKIDTAAIY